MVFMTSIRRRCILLTPFKRLGLCRNSSPRKNSQFRAILESEELLNGNPRSPSSAQFNGFAAVFCPGPNRLVCTAPQRSCGASPLIADYKRKARDFYSVTAHEPELPWSAPVVYAADPDTKSGDTLYLKYYSVFGQERPADSKVRRSVFSAASGRAAIWNRGAWR